MVRAGMRDEVLKSDTIWTCCSCYLCVVRCPRQIKITDIMYALKCLAIKDKKYSTYIKTPVLAKNFVLLINNLGRNQEIYLTISFFFLTNIFKMLGQLPLAIKLFFQNRLPFFPKKIKNLNQLQTIINRVEKFEEEGW
jgi:heterodisulfide reductase subunit C